MNNTLCEKLCQKVMIPGRRDLRIKTFLASKFGKYLTNRWRFNLKPKRFYITYNVPQQNWPLFLWAHIYINKASNPIILGVKWKPLISAFQWCHWIWDLDWNCLRYVRKHDSNLDIEAAQNDWLLIQGVWKERLISIWWVINLVWKLPYVKLRTVLKFSDS